MSKTVRLRDHLAAEVERLATQERRSLSNMVELLLEQALAIESAERGFAREAPASDEPREEVDELPDVKASVRVIPREEVDPQYLPDQHFKPDFKGKTKPAGSGAGLSGSSGGGSKRPPANPPASDDSHFKPDPK